MSLDGSVQQGQRASTGDERGIEQATDPTTGWMLGTNSEMSSMTTLASPGIARRSATRFQILEGSGTLVPGESGVEGGA
jgi:hypothetical protein